MNNHVNPKFDVDKHLKELLDLGLIISYGPPEEHLWYIKNFKKHQKINRPRPSKLPDPQQYKNLQHAQQEFTEYSVNGHGKITEQLLNPHAEDSENSLKEQGKEHEHSLLEKEEEKEQGIGKGIGDYKYVVSNDTTCPQAKLVTTLVVDHPFLKKKSLLTPLTTEINRFELKTANPAKYITPKLCSNLE